MNWIKKIYREKETGVKYTENKGNNNKKNQQIDKKRNAFSDKNYYIYTSKSVSAIDFVYFKIIFVLCINIYFSLPSVTCLYEWMDGYVFVCMVDEN